MSKGDLFKIASSTMFVSMGNFGILCIKLVNNYSEVKYGNMKGELCSVIYQKFLVTIK
jgi:hypothetical protein